MPTVDEVPVLTAGCDESTLLSAVRAAVAGPGWDVDDDVAVGPGVGPPYAACIASR